MNLVEIAKKAKGKSGFKFRKANTHVVLSIESSGHIYVAGNRADIDINALTDDYEVICDHPPKSWAKTSEEETGIRKCLACEREIQLKGVDMIPSVPEKIKLTKQEEEKELFLQKHMAQIRQKQQMSMADSVFIPPLGSAV